MSGGISFVQVHVNPEAHLALDPRHCMASIPVLQLA
jgi:hypothetical protein